MEFNISKCKVLRIASIKSVLDRDYFLGGIGFECVNVIIIVIICAGILILIISLSSKNV